MMISFPCIIILWPWVNYVFPYHQHKCSPNQIRIFVVFHAHFTVIVTVTLLYSLIASNGEQSQYYWQYNSNHTLTICYLPWSNFQFCPQIKQSLRANSACQLQMAATLIVNVHLLALKPHFPSRGRFFFCFFYHHSSFPTVLSLVYTYGEWRGQSLDCNIDTSFA